MMYVLLPFRCGKRKGTIMSLLAVLLVTFSATTTTTAEDYVPWDLRDHYSFSSPGASFSFDVGTAEWKVDIKKRGTIVQDARAEIVLASGEVVHLYQLQKISDTRTTISDSFGKGTRFTAVYETNKGFQVSYMVNRYKERPFLTLVVSLENTGKTPVEVAAIRPVVLPPGSVKNLARGVKVESAHATRRGDYSLVHGEHYASLLRFEVDDPDMILGIGLLQSGEMDSRIEIDQNGASWSGGIECGFSPSIKIAAGDKLSSDPVWLTFTVNDADSVQQYHSWAEGVNAEPINQESLPNGWMTLPENGTAQTLLAEASRWAVPNVYHVLVPGNWNLPADDLEGASPSYPRDMQKLARDIRNMSMKPGITVEPLRAESAPKNMTIVAEDGSRWLDLSNPKALKYGTKRMEKMADWTYEFYVVASSPVPDAVLQRMNMTRSAADMAAFNMIRAGSGGYPVLPSPKVTLAGDLEDWQRVVKTTEWYEAYGVAAGPVRFQIGELTEVSSKLNDAIRGFSGPVEFVGAPKRKISRKISMAMVPVRYRAIQLTQAIIDPNHPKAYQIELVPNVPNLLED
jgi:hypothetical protein